MTGFSKGNPYNMLTKIRKRDFEPNSINCMDERFFYIEPVDHVQEDFAKGASFF